MKLLVLICSVLLLVLPPVSPALADNPFQDPAVLRAWLAEAGADVDEYYKVSPAEQSVAFPSFRDVPNAPAFADLEAFLSVLNVTQMTYFVDDESRDIAQGFGVNPAQDWTIPDQLAGLRNYVDPYSTEFIIPLGLRKGSSDLTFDEWTEGNSEFALVKGTYDYIDYISGETVAGIPFKLIAERHPASDGWFPSAYRGVGSSVSKAGGTQVAAGLTAFAAANLSMIEAKRAAAMEIAYDELRARHFANYRLNGSILFVEVDGMKALVDLVPAILSREDSDALKATQIGAAVDLCEAQVTAGYSNWELPGQVALARVLFGGPFPEWERRMPIKDMPTGEFFEQLLNSIPGKYSFPTIVTRDEEDTGQNLDNRHVYTIRLERRTFWGDALMYNNNATHMTGMALVCVDYDEADIAKFLATAP